jgi:GrpB-like predicted nucleotidyltransferase (UPF0157 family)
MDILPYRSAPAEFCPHNLAVKEIARLLANHVPMVEPTLVVEHIGSTSIPGCGGKGVIDLAILYPNGGLDRAKAALDQLGFQRQVGREVFPESRPMRVGSVEHEGQLFRIHAHVIAFESGEHQELIWFRDLLRRNPSFRHRYEELKRAILASGVTDPVDYCNEKAQFITEVLKGRNSSRH